MMENAEEIHSINTNIPGIIYQFYALHTGEYGVSYVSESKSGVFGLLSDTEEFFQDFLSHVHEGDREEFMASVIKAVELCEPWDFEGRFVRPDGDIRWFYGRSIPTRLEDRIVFNGMILDVTDRKKELDKTRQTEEMFKNIFKMAPDGISISRLSDGLVINTNVGFSEISGWDRSEAIGRTSMDLCFWANPTDRIIMAEELRSGKNIMQREFQFRHKDGTIREGIYSARPILVENEMCIIFVMQDITEHINTVKALQENEEQLRNITTNLPGVVFQLNTFETGEYNVDYVNERIEDLFGLPPNLEGIVKVFLSHVHEDDRERFAASARKAMQTFTPWDYQGRFIRPDGELRWFHGRATPRISINSIVFSGIVLDITDQKQAEEKSRHIEEKLTKVFMMAPDIIAMTRMKDGLIAEVNFGFEEITGWTRSEVIGRTTLDIKLWANPEDRTIVVKELQSGKDVIHREFQFLRKDGTLRDGIHSARSILVEDELYMIFVMRDVTEHRKTEKELRKNEELLRGIANNIPGIIYQFSLLDSGELSIGYVSNGMQRILGLPHKDDGIYTEFISQIHSEDRPGFEESIRKAIETYTPWDFTGRFLKPNGDICWFHDWATLTRLEDRVVFNGILLDITKPKLFEEKSRISEEKFSKIFMMTPDIIAVTRMRDGLIADVNLGFEEISGWDRDEVIGKTSMEIGFWVNPTDREHLVEEIRTGKDMRQKEFQFRRKDGSVHFGIYSARSINLLDEMYLLFVMQDVTELRITEKALRENEERLSGIAMNIPGAVFQAYVKENGEYGLSYLSKRLTKNIGLPTDTGVPLSAYISYIHEDDRDEFVSSIKKSVMTCTPWDFEGRTSPQSGDMIWFHGRATPSRTEEGLIFNGIFLDTTIRKQAELEQEKLQLQLLQAQKMEAIGTLAGGVAHDFNNMLTIILGYTELSLMKCEPSEQIHANLKLIQDSALHSTSLVRQLLAFARKQTIVPKIVDLNEAIEVMLKMLSRLIGEAVDFAWVPGGELWRVKIDPSQIDQLLANLCVNARDAISNVGKIIIETENAILDGAYCEVHAGCIPGEYVMLAVSDNGCGMSQDTINKIFEPFFTTKEAGRGTGLGLATVYGIIKQNGGYITVYSEPGIGTTFKIYLPRSYGEATALDTKISIEHLTAHGETILLVEDDMTILMLAQAMLEHLGYTVLSADTPNEAIRIAKNKGSEIQLLITDIVMPEMNGKELAQLLLEIVPGIKYMFSSGYTADTITHHGILDEGANFLEKPYSVNSLGSKVREVLGQT
jgi:two-component system, cell cycle sensor histidine kinase and response regulator CckA